MADFPGHALAYVPDYSDHVGGGSFLPPPEPASLSEEERTLHVFLHLEADRAAKASLRSVELAVIDRSVHTLLAHCGALECMTGQPYLDLARRVLGCSAAPYWPDLVLYLDVPQWAVAKRNRGKFGPTNIFINQDFNRGVRQYFTQLRNQGSPRVVWLDATLPPATLRGIARELVTTDLLNGPGS